MNFGSIKNFFQVALLVMILVTAAMVAAIVTMHFAIHGAEVEVPSFKGMTVADARTQTQGLGLNLTVDNRYYSGEVPAGHILTQSPAQGTVVRKAWQVRVSESLGPQKVDVPAVVGREEHLAELVLRQSGLEVGATIRMPWAKASPGTVLAQDPPAHAQDIAGPAVNLLVAAPDDEGIDGYVMPDLVGTSATSAVATLARVGIKATTKAAEVAVTPVSAGNAAARPPVPPGAVLSQTPAAGARVDQTTTARLMVAR